MFVVLQKDDATSDAVPVPQAKQAMMGTARRSGAVAEER